MPLLASPTETGDGLEQPNPRKHNEMRSKLLLISGLWRWRVLDTFDWYSPRYQSWHTHHEVFGWFKENGLEQVEVLAPSVSQIGVKP